MINTTHMMKKTILFSFVILILSSGITFAQKGYKKVPFQEIKEIPEGKALVYIFRPSNMVGAALHYTVNVDDQKVSEVHLKNGTYLVYFADPGNNIFWEQFGAKRIEVPVEVEAGKTYYIKEYNMSLELVSEEIGKEKIKKCKMYVKKE